MSSQENTAPPRLNDKLIKALLGNQMHSLGPEASRVAAKEIVLLRGQVDNITHSVPQSDKEADELSLREKISYVLAQAGLDADPTRHEGFADWAIKANDAATTALIDLFTTLKTTKKGRVD